MYREIVCAGFGGQGIMLMAKVIAKAAMTEKKEVTWMPSYGAEVRGGTAHAMVVISDEDIALGIISHPNDCIAMNLPSVLKFQKLMKKDGIMIINSSLAKKSPKRRDIKVISIPATERAKQLGNIRVANMLALGAYQKISQLIKMETIVKTLKEVIPPHRRHLINLNITALEEGTRLADEC